MNEVDCRQVTENLYLLLDGELPAEACAELERHIDGCSECFGRYGVERDFKELVRRKCADEPAPAALVERIRAALRNQA